MFDEYIKILTLIWKEERRAEKNPKAKLVMARAIKKVKSLMKRAKFLESAMGIKTGGYTNEYR